MIQLRHRLVLASKSPRRRQLLREAGIPFEVRTREVNEDFPGDLPAAEVAHYLARKKAAACLDLIGEKEILLTADSTVVLGDTIFNKPADRAEAASFLRALAGKTHQVITGVCLRTLEEEHSFADVSQVRMMPLTEAEIDFYIDEYQPYDKAGAYAIQEWIGLCKVRSIEGSYYNIVGLPVDRVYAALQLFG